MDLILRRVNTCKGAHGSLHGPDPAADTLMDGEEGAGPKDSSPSVALSAPLSPSSLSLSPFIYLPPVGGRRRGDVVHHAWD